MGNPEVNLNDESAMVSELIIDKVLEARAKRVEELRISNSVSNIAIAALEREGGIVHDSDLMDGRTLSGLSIDMPIGIEGWSLTVCYEADEEAWPLEGIENVKALQFQLWPDEEKDGELNEYTEFDVVDIGFQRNMMRSQWEVSDHDDLGRRFEHGLQGEELLTVLEYLEKQVTA